MTTIRVLDVLGVRDQVVNLTTVLDGFHLVLSTVLDKSLGLDILEIVLEIKLVKDGALCHESIVGSVLSRLDFLCIDLDLVGVLLDVLGGQANLEQLFLKAAPFISGRRLGHLAEPLGDIGHRWTVIVGLVARADQDKMLNVQVTVQVVCGEDLRDDSSTGDSNKIDAIPSKTLDHRLHVNDHVVHGDLRLIGH